MCSKSFISLFKILIITITTQSHVYVANGYEINVIDILDVVKELSNNSDFIHYVAQQDPSSDINVTAVPSSHSETEEDSDKNGEDLVEHNETQSTKVKNILRWLPPRRGKKKKRYEKEKHFAVQTKKAKVVADHQKRISTVFLTMSDNYWTTLYLYGEMVRIKRDRMVMDRMRAMIADLELPGHERERRKVLGCYRDTKFIQSSSILDKGKTNNLIIRVVEDPRNE